MISIEMYKACTERGIEDFRAGRHVNPYARGGSYWRSVAWADGYESAKRAGGLSEQAFWNG
jgi:hypothetical protein